MEKIKNKYIIQKLFDYIEDESFKLKIFNHSKLFQTLLEINKIDYLNKFLKSIKFDLKEYLTFENDDFDKNMLKQKLNDFLLKYNIDIGILTQYIDNYYKSKEFDFYSFIDIDIYSPFLDIFSKNDNLYKFPIKIDYIFINENQLEDDYIDALNKLNELNINYSLILINHNTESKIDKNINYSKIKNYIYLKASEYYDYDSIFFTMQNTLTNLSLNFYYFNRQSEISCECINDLKSLNSLRITNLYPKQEFYLKLNNIKILHLELCQNIGFKDSILYLNELHLLGNNIIKPKSLLKLPLVKKFDYIKRNNITEEIFDFSSLNKLMDFRSSINEFLFLENPLLEILNIATYDQKTITLEKERKMLEKIISIKTLKKLDFGIFKMNEEISQIKNNNLSVKETAIKWKNGHKCILYDIQKNFPNLSILNIYYEGNPNINILNLELKNNKNYNVKKLSIGKHGIPRGDIKLYCNFENITNIKIYSLYSINMNITCFNSKYSKHFKSLKKISLKDCWLKLDDLKKIIKIIENMPSLQVFILKSEIEEINIKDYNKFIISLLNCNLKKMTLIVKRLSYDKYDKYCTIEEIKQMCPKIKGNLYRFKIQKLFKE